MENKNTMRVVVSLFIMLLFSGCIEIPPLFQTTTTTIETTITTTTDVVVFTTETTPVITTTTISCNEKCSSLGYSNGFCLDACEENFIDSGNEGCGQEQKCCCFMWDFVTTTIVTSTTDNCPVKCCSHSDCGERKITNNYTCDANTLYTTYIDPFCRYAATPSSECIGRSKREFVRACDPERERCINDESYCAFIREGEYNVLEAPRNAQIFTVTDGGLSPYDVYTLKIKYVISGKTEPEGICLYVKNPDLTITKFYLTDKYGQWLDNRTKIGIRKIFIYGSAISADVWGMKTE